MTLSATQQAWQAQYEALNTTQTQNKRIVDHISLVPEQARTQQQVDTLRIAQLGQIDAEMKLLSLQADLEKPLTEQSKWIDQRLASPQENGKGARLTF